MSVSVEDNLRICQPVLSPAAASGIKMRNQIVDLSTVKLSYDITIIYEYAKPLYTHGIRIQTYPHTLASLLTMLDIITSYFFLFLTQTQKRHRIPSINPLNIVRSFQDGYTK